MTRRPDEIYTVGTLANIVQSVRCQTGNLRVLVEGAQRAQGRASLQPTKDSSATLKVIATKLSRLPRSSRL